PSDGMLVGEPSLDDRGDVLAYVRRPRPVAGQGGPLSDAPAELWLRDITSGRARKLAPDGEMPSVSPNGRTVAFTSHGHTDVIQADGTSLRDLGESGCPVWSPDGTRLAMCSPDDTVFVLRLSDLSRVSIPGASGFDNPTAWS